jgi:DUF1009 family protein
MMAGGQEVQPLGIIAAAGIQPVNLAQYVKSQGREVMVITLEGIADADYSALPHQVCRLGAMDSLVNFLIAAGCVDVVLAGHLKRPSLADLAPDFRAVRLVREGSLSGDDALLKAIRTDFAKDGLRVIDISEVFPSLKAQKGVMVGSAVSAKINQSINLGDSYLAHVAGYDIGQACVVQGGRIIAVEAAEGTDAMLERCAKLIDPSLVDAVMVKMLKPDQDPALDPPGIGAKTMAVAAASGVKIVAVEADGVIFVDGNMTLAAAEEFGITLIGIGRDMP